MFHIMTYIVENRFFITTFLHGLHHSTDIVRRCLNGTCMARFIIYFKANDIGVRLISISGIRVNMMK
ncbi:hypothetical protein D3C73_467610 [compost metagenome]